MQAGVDDEEEAAYQMRDTSDAPAAARANEASDFNAEEIAAGEEAAKKAEEDADRDLDGEEDFDSQASRP